MFSRKPDSRNTRNVAAQTSESSPALGERLGVTETGTSSRLRAAITRVELPSEPPRGLRVEAVLAALRHDKKGRASRPRFVLLKRPGEVAMHGSEWSRSVPDALIEELIGDACKGA